MVSNLLPAVVITGSESYASCDTVAIDASATSGGAGRAMTFTWGLEPNIPNYAAIAALVGAQTGKTLIIAPNNLTAGVSYTFHVRVENFFNMVSTGYKRVQVSALPLPQILVGDGAPQVRTTRKQPLALSAKVLLSACRSIHP